MSNSLEKFLLAGYRDRIFDEEQLSQFLATALSINSPASRYGIVNRALSSGDLIRLKRGLYVFANRHRRGQLHPFAVARKLRTRSYVSMESALSFHQWIPEYPQQIVSITPDRKSLRYTVQNLQYDFYPIALNKNEFFRGVEYQVFSENVAYIATPLRGLLDLLYWRKEKHVTLDFLTNSLRIERDLLNQITVPEIEAYSNTYKSLGMKKIINTLSTEIRAWTLSKND